jgi:hypothetical protein
VLARTGGASRPDSLATRSGMGAGSQTLEFEAAGLLDARDDDALAAGAAGLHHQLHRSIGCGADIGAVGEPIAIEIARSGGCGASLEQQKQR